ncbi:MAG: hypothetical protein J0I19_09770 [Alphaproteobacteria bacterium]|nr:hypothetical protein [Alphaproteobacteria bacterium]
MADFAIGFPDMEKISGHRASPSGFWKNQRPGNHAVPVPFAGPVLFPMELAAPNRPRV